MRLFLKYFSKSILVVALLTLFVGNLQGQDFPGFHIYSPESDSIPVLMDSLAVASDTTRALNDSTSASEINPLDTVELFHSGLYVKVDYGKLLTLASTFESKWEATAGMVFFRRLVLNATYGQGTLDPKKAYKNVEYYTIEGSYTKFGMEFYFNIDPKSYFTLGGKYAMAQYSDNGKFLIGSEFWEEYEEEFGSSNLSSQWFELTMDSERLIAKNLFIGVQFSLRVMIDFETREDIPVHAIPGYGRTFDNSVPAASLFIKYKLPFN